MANVVLVVVFASTSARAEGYRSPIGLSIHPKTGDRYVLCQASGTVLVLAAADDAVKAEIEVGAGPWSLAWHPDRRRAYVTCRAADTVVEIDTTTLRASRRFSVRGSPTAVQVSKDGKLLFVGVALLDAVAVLELADGKEKRRIVAGNGPQFFAGSKDGRLLFASNLLSNPVDFQKPPVTEITVIDGIQGRAMRRILLEGANVARQIALSPDGSLGVVAISRPKNLLPMTQVAQGGVVTYGLAVFSPTSERPPVELLTDQPHQFYADLFGVAFTPDSRLLYVTASGADRLIVIDTNRLKLLLEDVYAGKWPHAGNHLGLSRQFVIGRIPTGSQPMGLASTPDGSRVYVVNRMSDSVAVLDVATQTISRTIALSEPMKETRLRRGERLFHNAAFSFQGQVSCASCHPDGGFDALPYDLQPDGLGRNLVDNRSLLGVAGTAPFKWVGSNPDLTTQCGARAAKWIFRTQGYRPSDLVALASYIRKLKPAQNPYRNSDGPPTKEQERGKQLYERSFTNQGKPIPENGRCITCHPLPLGSNFQKFDVGSASPTDTVTIFDVPHLTNIFESAPYLHDGRAKTLEEIWTVFNPHNTHGVTNDLRKQQLNDLIEYLKTL